VVLQGLTVQEDEPGNIRIAGNAGAIRHAAESTSLRIDNFGVGSGDPGFFSVAVAADGSFGTTVKGAVEDELRLQATRQDALYFEQLGKVARSLPVDVIRDAGSTDGSVVPPPQLDCLLIDSGEEGAGVELDFGVVASGTNVFSEIVVTNNCAQALQIEQGETLFTDPFWGFESNEVDLEMLPLPMPALMGVDISATAETALSEDVFLMRFSSGGTTYNRPVTLRVDGR